MKKIYIILALIVVSFMMVFAGNTIKILRIYHNGTFTAIPLTNIDSIDHVNGKVQDNYTSTIIEAIDSTYIIALNEIDSVIVTETDIEEYRINIETIRRHLIEQDELPIDIYQENLLKWLRNCNFISNAYLNSLNDKIIIEFSNGMGFIIRFIDISSSDSMYSVNNTRSDNKQDKEKLDNYIDVSEQHEETIIDTKNVLYIQGQSMLSIKEESKTSNAIKEHEALDDIKTNSPIETNIKPYKKTIDFFEEDFSKYSLIIISQNHGDEGRSGCFQIEDAEIWWKEFIDKGRLGIDVHFNNQIVGKTDDTEALLLWIYPNAFANKVNSKNIIYGSFCYSYDLYKKGFTSNNAKDATFYGYNSDMTYRWEEETPAKDSLIIRVAKLLNGYMFNQAFYFDLYYAPDFIVPIPSNKHLPVSNKQLSCQRFFSIKTEDITDNNEIKGQIKGYKNLKTEHNPNRKNKNDIIKKWILFAHEGKGEFKPEDNNVKRIEDAYKPDKDGNFTISSDIVNKYPGHAFIVAFEYAGKVYYGEPKSKSDISVSIEDISPVCDNHYVIIKGKVNGYDKLKSTSLTLCIYEGKEVITETNLDKLISNYVNEELTLRSAYFDRNDGSILCKVHIDEFAINTIYSFAFVLQNKIRYFSDTKYCSWELCPDDNHPHMIDLGLPSGTKWACSNVGTDKYAKPRPEDYGGYFAWAEIEEKSIYESDNYKYYNETLLEYTKYCTEKIYGPVDNKTSLDISDDVAHLNWGAPWRIPTFDEIKELSENCTSRLRKPLFVNGVIGGKLSGPNGKSIFIPAAGDKMGTRHSDRLGGVFWSSTLYTVSSAYCLWVGASINQNNHGVTAGIRYTGKSVRPVADQR